MTHRLLPLLALLASGCATTARLPPDATLQAHLEAAGAELEAIATGLGQERGILDPPHEAAYARARDEALAAVYLADARVAAAEDAAGRRIAREIADAVAACYTAIARLEAQHRDPGLTRGLFHLSAAPETCAIARETDRLLGR
jgi:hypothetical protein